MTGKVEWKPREDTDDEFGDHLLGSSYGGEFCPVPRFLALALAIPTIAPY